jgi:predicted aspartyl protease
MQLLIAMTLQIRRLAISVFLGSLFVTLCMAKPTIQNDTSEVPFTFENGFLIVEAKIKDKIPVQVVLATGAEYSILDMGLMEKYKLNANYASDGPVRGKSTDSTYTFSIVSGVSVGGSKTKDLQMRLGSLTKVSQVAGREVFAALGADFFEGQIVQFDFKKSVIRFLPKSSAVKRKNKNDVSDAGVVLEMPERASNPYKKTFVVPNVGDVTINGKEIRLLLDTGKPTYLVLPSSSAKKVGFTPPSENEAARPVKADSLKLAGYEITNVAITLLAKGSSADQSVSDYGLVAGSGFLRNFLVTFDFQNKLVLLERV